jgi:[ribosomal protein S5]-alanine N-acetyltransferase
MLFLETTRLLFRSHEPHDEPAFVQMHTDPEVRRYVGGQPWPLEKAIARFHNQYLGHPTDTYGLWATILKSEGRYIGACGLTAPPDQPAIKLGYYIARPYWGQGLASEACRAFLDFGFARLQLPRICADVDSRHEVSKHILEKFGFHCVSQEVIAANGRVICWYELPNPNQSKSASTPFSS